MTMMNTGYNDSGAPDPNDPLRMPGLRQKIMAMMLPSGAQPTAAPMPMPIGEQPRAEALRMPPTGTPTMIGGGAQPADPRTLQPEPTRGQFMPPVRTTGQKVVRGLETAGIGLLGGFGAARDFVRAGGNGPNSDAEKRFEQAHQTWQGDQSAARQASQDDLNRRNVESEITARDNKEPTPKQLTPEESTLHDLMTGENGQPRVNPETGKPYTYLEAYGSVKNAADVKTPPVKAPKEQIQQQLNDELSKPKPDQKIVTGLQGRLRDLEPLAEDRLRDSENRAAAAEQRATDAKNSKTETEFDRANAQSASKDLETGRGADFRYRSMAGSYPKAQQGDQQAMLNLLTNHIGMTLGLQKGARITKDILNEAQKSAPWLQNVKAEWGKDGYLQGVVLPAESMKQMMGLAESQRANAWAQAIEAARQADVADKLKIPSDVRIRVMSPDGKAGTIPGSQLSHAEDQGYTVAPQ